MRDGDLGRLRIVGGHDDPHDAPLFVGRFDDERLGLGLAAREQRANQVDTCRAVGEFDLLAVDERREYSEVLHSALAMGSQITRSRMAAFRRRFPQVFHKRP